MKELFKNVQASKWKKVYIYKNDLKTDLSNENNDNDPIIIFFNITIKILFFIFLYLIIRVKINQLPNLKIALCTMGKQENLYIKEFINHYIKLGIDKIFIYDDNDPNTEKFNDVITKKERKYVVIYDNIKEYIHNQDEAFTTCYSDHKKDFDWFIIVDIDEFLIIGNDTLKHYLSNNVFDKCDFIKINWVMPTDNDHLHYENKPLLERFKGPYLKSYFIKSIIRGNIPNLTLSFHTPTSSPIRNITCNNEGTQIFYKELNFIRMKSNANTNKAYIIHFSYKSTEEFINRMKRGYSNWLLGKKFYNFVKAKIKHYFHLNKPTKERVEYIERELNISLKKIGIKIVEK